MIRIRKILFAFIIPCTLFFIVVGKMEASSFNLDSNFGLNGKTLTSFGQNVGLRVTKIQQDNKIILAGHIYNGSNYDWIISRYNNDGNIDLSFGDNGKIIIDFGGFDSIGALDLQSDGKILAGGFTGKNNVAFNWTLSRFNVDGSLDTSFGASGFIFSNSMGVLNGLVVQPDNSIIAIGYFLSVNNGNDDVGLVKYNPDGSMDSSFGVGGKVLTPIGGSNDRGNAVIQQADGKIIVVGDFSAGFDDVFVARYNQNGSLDTTFGVNGKTILNLGAYSGGRSVALQADNKILITGGIINSLSNTYIARLNSNGVIDTSFGGTGKIIISFSSQNDSANSIVVQDDQKIILGGSHEVNGITQFAIRRFNPNGTLDSDFSVNGSLLFPFSNFDNSVISIKSINNDTILAMGNVSNGSNGDWGLVKFEKETDTLAVPLLMQTSPPWADDIYDSAPNWQSNGGVTIGRIGCAITSAAMVFRYHGLTKMPDGVTELDPGALNSWMNSIADRNFRNGATNWESLSKNLSPLLADVNNASFSKLEFKIDGQDNQKLNNYLTNNNPVILNVPGHFVVAKGLDIQNNSYYINDPFYDRTSLSSYNNQYSRAITYEPASSDLSYLIFIVDLSVDIDLLDDLGNPVGLKQIEEPVNDVLQLSTNLVGPLKAIYYPKPNSGNYTLQVSSDNTSSYKLDGYIYDSADGTMLFNRLGVVGSENTDTYQISFDKDDVDQSVIANPEITFNSLLSDLNILYQLGHITKKGSYNYLSNKIEQAQGYSTTNVERSKELLQKIKQQLIDDKRRGIDVFASQYLIEQIDVLLATL